jgi:dTDP-4-amino-4,6-dideoxygalactose transaminase
VVNDHLFHLVFPTESARDAALHALRSRGVMATFHYVPLHSSPFGRTLPGTRGEFPVSERVAARLLRLPLHPLLDDADVERVIEAVIGRPA